MIPRDTVDFHRPFLVQFQELRQQPISIDGATELVEDVAEVDDEIAAGVGGDVERLLLLSQKIIRVRFRAAKRRPVSVVQIAPNQILHD